jgi:hypothetical protein
MHDDLKDIIDEKSVKKEGLLILKGLLLLLPFCIAIIIYIYNDPFKELRLYDNYDYSIIFQNEGAASWHKYKLYCNKEHYDSFILGNSCTMAYRGEEWKKYINGSPFRLFGNDESIVDVYYKLKALDKQKGQKINNVLLVIDKSIFKYGTLRNSFMHILPPEVSGLSELRYQVSFIQGFFMPKFIIPYIDYLEFHHYRNNTMKGVINPVAYAHYGTMNNALNPKERRIILEKEKYWQTPEWKHLLSDGRSFKYSPRCIYSLQRGLFAENKSDL